MSKSIPDKTPLESVPDLRMAAPAQAPGQALARLWARQVFSGWPALWLGTCLIAGSAAVLYAPFLGNPLIFDDWTFFAGSGFAHYATHPFGFALRLPPYFSLAIIEVLSGSMPVQRIASLALHVACALLLYKLIRDLLRLVLPACGDSSARAVGSTIPGQAHAAAVVAAAAFAIHPVAVYASGYLVQRSIVFATLFSLLSAVLFVRGLRRGSHADAFSAALMYSVAVLSKEHSILLPAAVILTVALAGAARRFRLRHALIYLSACAPAAIFVAMLSKHLIGQTYEPSYDIIAEQMEVVFRQNIADFPWALSAVTQAGLYFKYLGLWLWPDTRAMSIDLRVDFLSTWSTLWILLKLVAFIAFAALGAVLLRRGGRVGMAGFGILYTLILFLTELSAARLQEPFVLYRSYIWAPGILIAVAAMLSAVPLRGLIGAFVLGAPLLIYQAHDRLLSFSSSFRLWEDAVAKLPSTPVLWGSRTLFNLTREYLYDGQSRAAIATAERCLAQYPGSFHCHSARGLIHLSGGELAQALPYLTRATELNPTSGIAHHRLALNLESLGHIEKAKAMYRRASDLGYMPAELEIRRLESTAAGLSAPRKSAPAAAVSRSDGVAHQATTATSGKPKP